MTINLPNLTRLRTTIAAAPSDLCIMGHVNEETSCGTAHCIAGWADALWPRTRRTLRSIHLATYLGIREAAAVELMLPCDTMSLHAFDYADPDLRKAAMLRVLDDLPTSGWPNWREALEATFTKEEFDFITDNRFA